jgi:hypothetical protein
MRTLVDLPDDDIEWLNRAAAEQGKSRAALVREAVSAYRAEAAKDWIDQAFGIWKDRSDIGDGLEWQRRTRAEWTRHGTQIMTTCEQSSPICSMPRTIANARDTRLLSERVLVR